MHIFFLLNQLQNSLDHVDVSHSVYGNNHDDDIYEDIEEQDDVEAEVADDSLNIAIYHDNATVNAIQKERS